MKKLVSIAIVVNVIMLIVHGLTLFYLGINNNKSAAAQIIPVVIFAVSIYLLKKQLPDSNQSLGYWVNLVFFILFYVGIIAASITGRGSILVIVVTLIFSLPYGLNAYLFYLRKQNPLTSQQ